MKANLDLFILFIVIVIAMITTLVGVVAGTNWLLAIGAILFMISYYLYSKLEDEDTN